MLFRRVKSRLLYYKEDFVFAKRFLKSVLKKKIFLLQAPEHNNTGDLALLLGEMRILSDKTKMSFIVITHSEYLRFKKVIKLFVKKNDIILIHAGGNMGTLWENEEDCRRDILQSFIGNKIISLPQTIYYEDSEYGRQSLSDSINIYSKHKNLILSAREKYSYEIMKNVYTKNKVYLIPDVALYLTYESPDIKRKGIVLCLRSDIEKAISKEDEKKIISDLENVEYRYTDMYCDIVPNKKNIGEIVYSKMLEFACAELVITDRLHGMVFAAITETPCVVLSNNHHKIKGVYEWIKDLPYIEYVENIENVKEAIRKVTSTKERHYDNTKFLPYYEKLIKEIEGVL